jgi:molecular chaperone DnaK
VEARNELDSAAYQVERRLSELGDAAPVHEKARAEMLVADARQAIQDEVPADRARELTSELQQVAQALAAAHTDAGQQAPSGAGAAGGGQADDDVIDAEFNPV